MSTLFLCGAGNPAGVRLAINVNQAINKWDRIIILDDNRDLLGNRTLDCEVAGGFSELTNADKDSDQIVNLVAAKTSVRWKVRNILIEYGLPFASLIHPAVDTLGVSFGGDDITVYDNATLGACSHMSEGCIVFMNAILGHGARMAEGSILAPGAVLNARVDLGERAYFGTNASILQDLTVGSNATVGANSSVVCDIPNDATAIGIPAEVLTAIDTSEGPAKRASRVSSDPHLLKSIETIWREILEIDKIHPNDNFFDAGGTSIKAIQIIAALKNVTTSPLALTDVFRYPTIESLANHLGVKSDVSMTTRPTNKARERALKRRKHYRDMHA